LETLIKRLNSDSRKAKADKDLAFAVEVYKKIEIALNKGQLVSDIDLDEDELKAIRDLHLLTNKEFVYACNVSEDMMGETEENLKKIL